MAMTRSEYVVRRLVQLIPALFGVTLVVFAMLRLIPGDPVTALVGEHASDETIARVRHSLGLDQPIWLQYVYYLRSLVTLNLGESHRYGSPVAALIGPRLTVSIAVALYTVVLTTLFSVPLGVLSALYRDSWFDHLVRSTLVVTMVMPTFWVGIMLILFFSIRLGWFPVSGFGDGIVGHLWHLFLPALTLSLGLAPILIRALRASMLQTLSEEYVKTARAKGLAEGLVIRRHVLRNALIPWATLLGVHTGFLMGGTVITEKVFALPGAGALLIDSVAARDYPVVQALTLVFALLVILVNLLTDLLYSFLDPRVRY
jgi:peptide/nickel transport system permease protein